MASKIQCTLSNALCGKRFSYSGEKQRQRVQIVADCWMLDAVSFPWTSWKCMKWWLEWTSVEVRTIVTGNVLWNFWYSSDAAFLYFHLKEKRGGGDIIIQPGIFCLIIRVYFLALTYVCLLYKSEKINIQQQKCPRYWAKSARDLVE